MSATEPEPRRRSQCLAVPGGEPCQTRAAPGLPYCRAHLGPLERRSDVSPREFLSEWRPNVERAVARRVNRRPMKGNYDQDLVKALLPLAAPLYSWYWRVEVHGVENIPTEGAALLASNHSGTLPIDGAMLKVAVLREHGRNPGLLAGDLVFRVPGLKQITRTAGNARADREETLELLHKGELVGVFPEGYKGIGKGFQKRYQLQRFGRGGFVETAMEVGCPIIPVAIVGAEEAYPMIADVKPIANLFQLPYFPITPFFPLLGPLGAIPLPSKWIIAFGKPIPTAQHGPEAVDDQQLVLELAAETRQAVQGLLADNLPRRRNAFY